MYLLLFSKLLKIYCYLKAKWLNKSICMKIELIIAIVGNEVERDNSDDNITLRWMTGGPFTVFAPTNQAFSLISPSELNAILNDPVRLTKLLKHHVVQDLIYTSGLQGFQKAYALDYELLYIYHSNGINSSKHPQLSINHSNNKKRSMKNPTRTISYLILQWTKHYIVYKL